MLRPYMHRRTSGDARDDGDRVARLDRRLALGELPDVPVVYVDVHKAAQPAVGGKQMRLQGGVLAGEPVEQLPDAPSLYLDRVTPAHERAERRRDQNRHCHTTFRSSLVIGSSSKAARSSVKTQLFKSPARPCPPGRPAQPARSPGRGSPPPHAGGSPPFAANQAPASSAPPRHAQNPPKD